MLKPSQIRKNDFSKATMGGYRINEVDDFLNKVAESYEQLFRENGELVKKLRLLVDSIEQYRKKEQEKETTDLTVAEAEKKAQSIIDEARKTAGEIIADAKKTVIIPSGDSGDSKAIDEQKSAMRAARDKTVEMREKFIALFDEQINAFESVIGKSASPGASKTAKDEPAKPERKPLSAFRTHEKKVDLSADFSDAKFIYTDVDEFVENALTSENSGISEAFEGFRFDMGPQDGEGKSVFEFGSEEDGIVIPDVAESNDDENSENYDVDDGDYSENEEDIDAEDADDGDDEKAVQPVIIPFFDDDNSQTDDSDENVDDLFKGFVKDKKNGKK